MCVCEFTHLIECVFVVVVTVELPSGSVERLGRVACSLGPSHIPVCPVVPRRTPHVATVGGNGRNERRRGAEPDGYATHVYTELRDLYLIARSLSMQV